MSYCGIDVADNGTMIIAFHDTTPEQLWRVAVAALQASTVPEPWRGWLDDLVDSRRRSFGAAPLTKSQLAALCSEMFTALMPLGPEAGPESSGGTPCSP